jgi:hypothetical protein
MPKILEDIWQGFGEAWYPILKPFKTLVPVYQNMKS